VDAPPDYFSHTADRLISQLIEDAAVELGMSVTRHTDTLITCANGSARFAFYRSCSSSSSFAAKELCDDKRLTKRLLHKAGLKVSRYRAFFPEALESGLAFAEKIGWNVVVKPARGSRSRGVSNAIGDPEAFHAAWEFAVASRERKSRCSIIVEKHFEGVDHRFFVVGSEVVAVLRREPAHVVGDGKATVSELIAAKNALRARNPDLCRRQILVDDRVSALLAHQGMNMQSVPTAGLVVRLRRSSEPDGPLFPAGNGGHIALGGDSIDLTDEAHDKLKQLAVRALAAIPGLTHGGVDILAVDITQPPSRTNHVVSEIEFDPAMSMHHFPAVGQPRNVARAILLHCLNNVR
jgi:D-alanine-D-alanine ligase-like ATP-grasp enzyme